MTVVGYLCIVVAALWIPYKIYLSYMSFGGTVMVTVYDAAMYPPVVAAFGLYWVLPTFGVEWPIWAYLGIAVGIGVLTAVAVRVAEELGDRRRF